MFLGRNAGLGLSSTKELSLLSNGQLGLTDRAVSSLARLAETNASKSAVLKDRASKGLETKGSKGAPDNREEVEGAQALNCADNRRGKPLPCRINLSEAKPATARQMEQVVERHRGLKLNQKEEDVSEIEDNNPDFDPDHHETEQSTDGEEEAPEEEAPGEEAPEEEAPGEEAPEEEAPGEEAPGEGAPGEDTPEVTFQSKDGNLLWYSPPQERGGRARGENIIRMTPGSTRYATSHVDDIKSSFQLFLPESIMEIILPMTNLEGGRVFADTWKALDQVDLQAYMGLLILSGVHRSNNEATKRDAESGRPIFRSTMSLQQFHVLSRVIRFDNRATQPPMP
ncbi:hypothetical protein N1851_002909 [Merluccius polli]|uniref:PiggyBac transposable element-derived protein domain-containing protein n=1 Tax=Merluccius polli TaxID=89951 RepID=A0AA47P884_MERPO|nr:hypothetical protein N1851_002909 [Merluccius polli]